MRLKTKIPNDTNLATTTALTAVVNKMPNAFNLVKKLTITQKLVKLKIKLLLIMIMINILLLKNLASKKLTSENFTAGLKQANLASKNNISNFAEKTDFGNKLKNVTSS